jgi:formylglycine-generating enzyme required for sulfatase activity
LIAGDIEQFLPDHDMRIQLIAVCGQALGAARPQPVDAPPAETRVVGDITFVGIPGGEFMMGVDSAAGPANERPPHTVKLDPFWTARTELTLAQWKTFPGQTATLQAGRADVATISRSSASRGRSERLLRVAFPCAQRGSAWCMGVATIRMACRHAGTGSWMRAARPTASVSGP